MEESQAFQVFSKQSLTPIKPIIPKIDISGLSPKKSYQIKRNIKQLSDFRQSQTPSSSLLNRSEEKIKRRLLKCQSNDIMSKSAQFSETLNNYEQDGSRSQSPLDLKKIGNTFLKDQIEEQKKFKLKEEIQKQIALQQRKIEKLQNQTLQNPEAQEISSEGLQKGLNLNQFLQKKDILFEQKRNYIKQRLAEIGFDDAKKMLNSRTYSSNLFIKKSQNNALVPTILVDGKPKLQNTQMEIKLKNNNYRNSILVNQQFLGFDSSQDQSMRKENASINGSLEDQYESEQNKNLKTNTKEIYFSSVMDPAFMSQSESVPNQNLLPLRKRIPNISADPNMNQAIAILINKTKEQRNQEDIAMLMRATKQIPFFNKIESKVLLYQNLCKAMQYQYVPKGGVVFYYGDFPDRFYITLKGKVSILIPKKSEDIQKEDLIGKEMKSTQLATFTIHKRFLYKSLHRAYRRLCNILYFILILKIKANILQNLPPSMAVKSKADFTLNSLPEGDKEDSDESSSNIPRNHSFVLAAEQNIDDQKMQKSKVDLTQMNDYLDNELDRALKGIRQQNQEKKVLFKQQVSSFSNLKVDNSRIRHSSNNIADISSVSFRIPNQEAKISNLNQSHIRNNNSITNISLTSGAKNNVKMELEINDAQSLGISKLVSIGSNNSGGESINMKYTAISHLVDPNMKTTISEKKKKEYQPIQPPQSYLEIISHFKNISQPSQIVLTRETNPTREDSITVIPISVLREQDNIHHDEQKDKKEFRQPVDKYKDMFLNKIIEDESQDPMFHSNQLYIAKLDQEMKDIRRPSQLNISLAGQVENLPLAQKLQNASQVATRRRSVLKIAIDAFVNTNNQNTYKLYQEKKKLIEQQVKGLELEKLENGAHFFKNNTFKYNHAFTSGDGLVFGELGILNKKPRAATIVCLEDCYFGYLSSQNYQQILMKKEKSSLIKKREFIESTLMQDQMSGEKMSKVSYYFHKRKYQSGEIVYKEGEVPLFIYLIKKGEIELQKEVEVINNEQEQSKVTIRVAKLSSREYFGDCDIFYNRKRKFTAVVTQESTIYFCERGQFIKQLEEIKEFWEKYGERIQIKEDYRIQQIEESKITRNFEKNLRKYSSPKKRIRQQMTQNQQQQKQQKMDSIICGVHYNMQNDQIDDQTNLISTVKKNMFSSAQNSPRQNTDLDDNTRNEKLLMAKSALYTSSQKKLPSLTQNLNEIPTLSQQKIQIQQHNYNQEKVNNSQEDNQQFFSPEKVKALHKLQIENHGYISERNRVSSPNNNKEDTKTFVFSFKDIQESKTDRILTNRQHTPLTKKDLKNIYAPIYSSKDLVLEDESQQTKQIESNTQSSQITYRSNQNSGQITGRSYFNNVISSNRQSNSQFNDLTTSALTRQERIAGQIVQNGQQQEIIEQQNQKKEQLQELREEFSSGMEALRKLKKDIKINKELLKKGAKHQKKISAHDSYKITKEVCMQNDEIYQREQKVNAKRNKIQQIEIETGIRKQMHHSKKGSEICSIYSKLSSMEDKVTFQNTHSLEPEVVVQSPLFSRKNSNHDIFANHILESKPNSIKDSLNSHTQTNSQPHALADLQIQKNTSIFLRERLPSYVTEETLKLSQGYQTTNNINTISNQNTILPFLVSNRESKSTLKRGQSTSNFSSINPVPLIKTSQYFLLQDKGFGGNINNLHKEPQSRTLSNKRNQQPHFSNNYELNISTNENQRSDTGITKHRHTQSTNAQKQIFLPIHSEKIFSNTTKNTEDNNSNQTQQYLIKKLSSKDLTSQFKNLNIHSRPHQYFQSISTHQNKSVVETKQITTLQQKLQQNNVRQQQQQQLQNKQVQVEPIKQQIGQQLCFDDKQVEKIPIKRFDFKKNYLSANKITIINHMQKPILIKSD